MAAAMLFDVVLMDLNMPGMTGRQTTALIRAGDGPSLNTPILAFTAVETAMSERLEGLGFDGLVCKPINTEQLLSMVAAVVAAAPSTSSRTLESSHA